MDEQLLTSLAEPKGRQFRDQTDRTVLRDLDLLLCGRIDQLLRTAQKSLQAQSCYDSDDFYAMLAKTFPDARVRPHLGLKATIRDDRVDICWFRYRRIADGRGGYKVYSKVFPRGTRTSRQSMRPFMRQPVQARQLISFIETRCEARRERSAILSKMLKLARQYRKLSEEGIA
ncbi:MAG: hypothetical protein IJ523_04750 [Succinivibrionaceae bacterium]|nr:hypothetical protein [Succinivibrionaceae bacterium]